VRSVAENRFSSIQVLFMPLPSATGELWLKLFELWSLAELSGSVSRVLTAIYMLKAGGTDSGSTSRGLCRA